MFLKTMSLDDKPRNDDGNANIKFKMRTNDFFIIHGTIAATLTTASWHREHNLS